MLWIAKVIPPLAPVQYNVNLSPPDPSCCRSQVHVRSHVFVEGMIPAPDVPCSMGWDGSTRR
eukprot:3880583-Prorocentrum_lima.AAC.1